jgi:hypothetical protein
MSVNGRAYFIYGQAAVSSPTKSLLSLTGGTTIRPSIYDFYLGSSATPADNALLWKMQRTTAAGTSTAFTPVALEPADPAAIATAGYAHSAEPTYTANSYLFWLALNQRATHRAILDPSRPLGIPATANNGIGLFVVHSSFTGNADATAYYYE